jgi:gluconokinase
VIGFKPHFFFLEGSESVIAQRMKKRSEHFFPVNLLHSQFQTLEHPKLSQQKGEELDVNIISIEQSINAIVTKVEHAAIKFITSGA